MGWAMTTWGRSTRPWCMFRSHRLARMDQRRTTPISDLVILPPAGPFGTYTDYVAPRFTVVAILAALEYRRRTGQGQYIDQSQAESALHFLTPALLDYTVHGRSQERGGNADAHLAPHGVYPAAGEDRWLAIAVRTEAQWQVLCEVMQRPDLGHDWRFATLAARLMHR